MPDPPDLGDAPWLTEAGQDMKGYRLSTYTGKYYDKSREQYRICVIQRESGGNYDEPSGPWRGAYQFSDSLAAGALRAMRAEMVEVYGDAGKRVIDSLEGTLIYTWPRFFQDMAFWTTFNRGAGASHWAGGSWYCNPARNAESGWPNPSRWNYTPLERDKGDRGGKGDDKGDRTSTPTAAFGTPEYSQQVARAYIRDKHDWRYPEFRALKDMWWRESNWRYSVINPHPNGPWYGLGQVNGGFIADQGYSIKEYMASPEIQIKVGAAYIKQRYGSPTKAWSFWQSNGWY
ncbi:MAG: hypothetical protein B7C55_02120 [Actinomycetales bacterium mxb001]|nr:MAG: hypothetical protein B7C55_02120 [Actinomycetales bacterium mxb001]